MVLVSIRALLKRAPPSSATEALLATAACYLLLFPRLGLMTQMAATVPCVAVRSLVGHTLGYPIIGPSVSMVVLSPQNLGITYQKLRGTGQSQQQSGGPCFHDTKQFGEHVQNQRDKLSKDFHVVLNTV